MHAQTPQKGHKNPPKATEIWYLEAACAEFWGECSCGTRLLKSFINTLEEQQSENHLEGGWIGDNANQCTI